MVCLGTAKILEIIVNGRSEQFQFYNFPEARNIQKQTNEQSLLTLFSFSLCLVQSVQDIRSILRMEDKFVVANQDGLFEIHVSKSSGRLQFEVKQFELSDPNSHTVLMSLSVSLIIPNLGKEIIAYCEISHQIYIIDCDNQMLTIIPYKQRGTLINLFSLLFFSVKIHFQT